jgi:arginase
VAGAHRDGASVALVYIDLDVDLNAPAESDGALDWTGVAHLLALPGTAPELSGLGSRQQMLESHQVLYFAADNIEPNEAAVIALRKIAAIRLAQVKAGPRAAAEEAVRWAGDADRMLVHLDADVLSFTAFPIAENTRRRSGLTLEELSEALGVLVAAPNWSALTLAEFNPDHAPDETETFRALVAMLAAALAA